MGALLAFVILLGVIWTLPRVVWVLRWPFLMLNWLQWYLSAPFQNLLTIGPSAAWPRKLYVFLTPARLVYAVAAYVLLAPLRLLNAVYFNLMLYWSVTLYESIIDVLQPQHGHYARRGRVTYCLAWALLLPWRLAWLCFKCPYAIFQGLTTTVFDIVWPTLTMFHGTDYQVATGSLGRKGIWYVGNGNWVGTGIYFGLSQRVARHYARSGGGRPAILVARVTVGYTRHVVTLKPNLRQLVGRMGSDGDRLTRAVITPFVTLLHWRSDNFAKWFEFCVPAPRRNQYVNSWRMRPICVTTDTHRLERCRGGIANWPASAGGWVILAATLTGFWFACGLAAAR